MIEQIEGLLKHETAGDPIRGTKWTRTTTEKIAEILRASLGISICKNTVGKLLKEMGYSLKVNRKMIPVSRCPDRNKQFEVIHNVRSEFEDKRNPVISVDAKKRELVGLFKNSGTTWSKKPICVHDHDFPSTAKGVAIPYGVYDVQENLGFLFVGTSHDTPEFAAGSVTKWWRFHGRRQYPDAKELLVLADAGGSNNPRYRAWKQAVQKFCDRYGLTIRICHYPTGASKWNPIEHRLFSEVSKNWAGRPLESYETILNYAHTTKTRTGLKVKSYLDLKDYPTGVKVSDEEMERLSIQNSKILGKWNYTIKPR